MAKYTDAELVRLFEEGVAKGAEWLFMVRRPSEDGVMNESHHYVMPGEDFLEVSAAVLNEVPQSERGLVYSLLETKEEQDRQGQNDLAYTLLWMEWVSQGRPQTLEWQERLFAALNKE